jgi:hypothetical protein
MNDYLNDGYEELLEMLGEECINDINWEFALSFEQN